MRAHRPIRALSEKYLGRWVAEIMVAGSIPTALTSEEQRVKRLSYQITKGQRGEDKTPPLNRIAQTTPTLRVRALRAIPVRPTVPLGIQPWRGVLIVRTSTYWSELCAQIMW